MITQARCETPGRLLRTLALKPGEKFRKRPGAPETRNGAGLNAAPKMTRLKAMTLERAASGPAV